MTTFWRDSLYAFRIAIKDPMFSVVIVLILAFGIGANTAIFSVVNAVLLRPLPYPRANELVMIFSSWPAQGILKAGSALPDYREYRDHNRTLEGLAGFYYGDVNLSVAGQT